MYRIVLILAAVSALGLLVSLGLDLASSGLRELSWSSALGLSVLGHVLALTFLAALGMQIQSEAKAGRRAAWAAGQAEAQRAPGGADNRAGGRVGDCCRLVDDGGVGVERVKRDESGLPGRVGPGGGRVNRGSRVGSALGEDPGATGEPHRPAGASSGGRAVLAGRFRA